MTERDDGPQELLTKLAHMERRIAELEKAEAEGQKARQELKKSKRAFEAFLNATTELALLVDTEGLILAINGPFAERFGRPIDELLDKGCFDSMAPEFAAHRRKCLDQVIRSGKPLRFRDEREARILDHNLYPVSSPEGKVEAIAVFARDITEQERTGRALRVEKQKFETLFEQAPLGLLVIGGDTTFQYINPRFHELFGYSTEEIRSGRQWFELAYPDPEYRQGVISAWKEYAKVPKSPELRTRAFTVTCKDRTRKIIQFKSVPLDSDQHLLTCEDITEFRQTEEALRHSEQMLKNILSASPMAISYVQGAKLRWTNQAMVHMFRYEHEDEYLGEYAKNFYASDDEYDRIRSIFIQGVGEGKPVETEALFRRKDGTVFYGHLRISPLDHSDPAGGIISTIADISEKKEAERRLLESEERYRELYEESKKREELYSTLLNSSADAVVVYDMEGRTRYVNDSFTRIFGWTMEELKNRQIPYLPDSERQRTMEIIGEILRDGVFWSGFESRRYTKDGRVLDVRLSASRYHDHEGNPSGMLVTLGDITEQKRLEEKLRQAAKMEAIGRLAGGVAHDFNNLLTAIIGYSEMLLHEIPQNAKYRHKVLQISNAAERTSDLTRQLLAFSRKQILDVTVVNLNTVIGDLENLLRRLIGEDVELVTCFDYSLGCTKADRSQIEQILVNLVVNARDAMPKGGTLTIETANAELADEYVRKYPDVTTGPYVLFAVSDTGHGMEANVLSRIFDPFFTTKEKGLGTGLGLSTVYGIVKQHQGHVAVYSEPGRGTTFKVYLPRVDEIFTQQSQAPTAHALPRGNEVILLVEDEEIVRKLACDVLEMLGYRPLAASDPDEAIAACLKHEGPIHLMLTDVVLPRMDGRSLYNLLSSTKPDMKVLYMSGYAENAVVHHGVLDRGVHFLQKPFNTDSLALKVRAVLDEA